ncbi:MAG: hypothetical protein V1872_14195 [bacterium]
MNDYLISNEAEKYYKRLDKNTKQKINKGIDTLGTNPLTGTNRHLSKIILRVRRQKSLLRSLE